MTRARRDGRDRVLRVNVSQAEFDRVTTKYKNTTFKNRSDFFRSRIFGDPETVFYRSKSLDEFIPIALRLKNELADSLKILRETLVKISAPCGMDYSSLLVRELQQGLASLEVKADEIRERLIQIYDQCA